MVGMGVIEEKPIASQPVFDVIHDCWNDDGCDQLWYYEYYGYDVYVETHLPIFRPRLIFP